MARSANQKLKLLYLLRILTERTDEQHPMTVAQLIEALAGYDIQAERKSIYSDLEELRRYGLDIVSHGGEHYVGARTFELPELKLLVDAVQSAKFIPQEKTGALIRKLESLTSVYEARQLQRQVYVSGRVKAANRSIYYNVDTIHGAIAEGRQIGFSYFEWDLNKQKRYRHDKARYIVSPWALAWEDENYYLIAYDARSSSIRHYRVDKMEQIEPIDLPREGQQYFERFDLGAYSRKVFGMFAGPEQVVRVRFAGHLVGVVLDRFGHDVPILPQPDGSFLTDLRVAVSPQFFSWLFGFGEAAQVLGPPEVVDQMRDQARRVLRCYQPDAEEST